jgi:hypothetical protein
MLPNRIPNRVCITPKDVCNITGLKIRSARKIINDIKLIHKKKKHQLVTVHEFSQYMDIPLEEVKSFIVY